MSKEPEVACPECGSEELWVITETKGLDAYGNVEHQMTGDVRCDHCCFLDDRSEFIRFVGED